MGMEKMPPPNTSPVRVLVVDDHPSTATTLARAISQLGPGVDVLSAESGEKALELVKNKTVDLLITDMVMPGMNGLELIEVMQSHPGGRPAYAALITAYDVPGLKETARRLKVNDVIMKPVRPERICQIVSKTIENLGHAPLVPPPETKSLLKILIADDQQDNIALLSRYLENEGYACITANNGIVTLQKMRTELPDLVLLDVNMPGKDGFEALQEIRTDPSIGHIPVIILTAARLESADMQYALNMGADDYITKPFDRRELLARIRTRLRVKEAEDTIRRQNKELNLLPEIGRELSARLDVDELMNVVLHRTVETLGALLGQMVVLTRKRTLTKTYHFSGSHEPGLEPWLPPVEDLLIQARETRQGFIIKNVHEDRRWKVNENDPTRSIMVVPMLGRFDLLGLLVLAHEQTDYFTMEHKLLLQAIASQAAIAVENAQLHETGSLEQQRMMAILENSAGPILLFDHQNRLIMSSPTACKLFDKEDLLPGQPLRRGRGFDHLIDIIDQSQLTHQTSSDSVTWPDRREIKALIVPIQDGGYVVHLHDLSHEKNKERSKTEFLTSTTHDLKNPLTLISLTSELIPKAGPLMDGLLQDLLELAMLDEVDPVSGKKEVDLNKLVTDIADQFQLLAEVRQQTLQLETAKIPPVIKGNPFQLRHALNNLVDNAIKYTPTGGAICIFVESTPDEAIIRIKDNGYGIPSRDLPFIFDRFYRVHTKETEPIEGSGLGLAIVKPIIEQHGGKLSVESELKKGSCFSISLPLVALSENKNPGSGGQPQKQYANEAKSRDDQAEL
jgi:CheY-like chemotaxis protein/signal transduction histidine kinase